MIELFDVNTLKINLKNFKRLDNYCELNKELDLLISKISSATINNRLVTNVVSLSKE